MAKVRNFGDAESPLWHFECPGCGYGHAYDKRWSFNGNVDRPTFSPSLLVNANTPGAKRCHLFVTDGKIQFCGDCDHDLRSQTVEMGDTDS